MSLVVTYGIVVGVYLLAMVGIGLSVRRRGFDNLREWALEKGHIGAFAITLTIFATLYSAFTYIGMPGYYYAHGIGTFWMITLPLSAGAILIYFAGRKMLELNVDRTAVTPLELFSRNMPKPQRGIFVVLVCLFVFVFNVPYVVTQIAGIGKVLEGLTDGEVSYTAASIISLVAIFLYVELGGMKGIILTDIVQGLFGFLLMTVLMFSFVMSQGGFGELFSRVQEQSPEHLSLPGPLGALTEPRVIAVALGMMVFSVSFIHVLTRMMLFRTRAQVTRTAIGFGVGSLAIGGIALVIGIGAAVAFPGLADKDLAIVAVIKDSPLIAYFGNLLGAMFFVALLTGAMSTADSVLFAMGTAFSNDVCKGIIKPDLSEKAQTRIVNVFIFVFLVVCYWISRKPPKLIVDLSIVMAAAVATFVPAFLAILFWRAVPATLVVLSVLVGEVSFLLFKWGGVEPITRFGAAFDPFFLALAVILLGWIGTKLKGGSEARSA